MVDQQEAILVTTGLTDTVYLVRPTGIQIVNPRVRKQQPFILQLSYPFRLFGELLPSHLYYSSKHLITSNLSTLNFRLALIGTNSLCNILDTQFWIFQILVFTPGAGLKSFDTKIY
jgi:hypothetical protein